MQPSIRRRVAVEAGALPSTLHPVLRRVYAQRGLASESDLSLDLKTLLPPAALRGLERACELLEGTIRAGARIVVVGDYDADGATGSALAVSALRALGALSVDYLVPSRFSQGYGLSPPLADAGADLGAKLLLTVDNGIASLAGVVRARELGMAVVVTDHNSDGLQDSLTDSRRTGNTPEPWATACALSRTHPEREFRFC